MGTRNRLAPLPAASLFFACACAVGCTAILGGFEVGGAVDADAGTDAGEPDAPSSDAGPDASSNHLSGVKLVTLGARHSCALTNANEVFCWGDNADGQLGLPAATIRSERPVKITLPDDVKELVAGAFHTCAVTRSFDAWCWGRNACGQVGAGDDANPSRAPRKVTTPSSGQPLQWSAIAPGLDHTCGIESGGATYCWGCNADKQAGAIGAAPSNIPVNAGIDKQSAVALSAGPTHTCIRSSASPRVRCWGTSTLGALGDGPPASDATDNAVEANVGTSVTALSAGDAHTCALDANKSARCWGDNAFGQLGNTDAGALLDAPGSQVLGGQALAIAAGGAFTCVLSAADAKVRCFGKNESGELGRAGTPDTATHAVPEPVVRPGSPTAQIEAASIGAGRDHACAVLTGDGEVVCWGKGADGQLGDGTAGGEPRTSPVFVLRP
ncbi:MAG: hypothetical protein KF764_31015 [Labilithrix sp.]|nr:hypothetical protein [Labilithrix sp.]